MRLPTFLSAAFLLSGCGSAIPNPAATQERVAASTSIIVDLPPEPVMAPPEPEVEVPSAEVKPPEPAPEETQQEAADEAPPKKDETEPPEKKESGEKQESAEKNESAEKKGPAEKKQPAAEKPKEALPAEARLVRAKAPLSDGQMARTIERIGYSCGKVVGTQRVEGQSEPMFRINCSSGETFRGSTKRGRLFFRRWSAGPSGR